MLSWRGLPQRMAPVLVLGCVVGCHRTKEYEAQVQIDRIGTVERDSQGRPLAMDIEISYVDCPGDQVEVVRGGSEFSECVRHLKTGDRVGVKIVHQWSAEGHYEHDVFELEGCKRPPDPQDVDEIKLIRRCSDWVVNEARVGFQCDYTGSEELVKKCPWFRRH